LTRLNREFFRLRAEILKALAHPTRLAIVDFLKTGEKCVCEIIEYLGEKQSNVSKHLSILRQTGIVDTRKDGLNVYYILRIPCVTSFFQCMDDILIKNLEENMKVLGNN